MPELATTASGSVPAVEPAEGWPATVLPTARTPRPTGPGAKFQRVAAIIPALNEEQVIASTVRAVKAIPNVDLVLVVDDGSTDRTGEVARGAGAVVVRHPHNRGKSETMETGAQVVAMRDLPGGTPRLLLFIDADMGEAAVNAAPLVPPVLGGYADLAIALQPLRPGVKKDSRTVRTARHAIKRLTGWTPTQPLGGMRCLTREAFEAATPLAYRWGVEVGMTIDLVRAGYVAVEVPCDLHWQPSSLDGHAAGHRMDIFNDVVRAITVRRLRAALGG
ncbi:MAG: glycosyltransferase family 2 protein [Promicromonosporaceae bacterium]|nr:glycosyltransferase family 2 protein [Promicromonosporaceae bacterium]